VCTKLQSLTRKQFDLCTTKTNAMAGSRKCFSRAVCHCQLAHSSLRSPPLVMEIGVTWFVKQVKWSVHVCHHCKVLFSMHQMLLFCAVCTVMFKHGCRCDIFASLLNDPKMTDCCTKWVCQNTAQLAPSVGNPHHPVVQKNNRTGWM